MKTSYLLVIPFVLLWIQLFGCAKTSEKSPDLWEYPVQLGDSRAIVHEFLSHPERTTEVLEEYPMSGVTVWFASDGRLTKINFEGDAGAIYSEPDSMISANWIPSDRPFYSGLTGHSNEDDFKRALGSPIREYTAPAPYRNDDSATFEAMVGMAPQEVRRIWKKGGFLIDALFLSSDRSHEDKKYPKGSLLWCEISHGI